MNIRDIWYTATPSTAGLRSYKKSFHCCWGLYLGGPTVRPCPSESGVSRVTDDDGAHAKWAARQSIQFSVTTRPARWPGRINHSLCAVSRYLDSNIYSAGMMEWRVHNIRLSAAWSNIKSTSKRWHPDGNALRRGRSVDTMVERVSIIPAIKLIDLCDLLNHAGIFALAMNCVLIVCVDLSTAVRRREYVKI